MQNAPHSRVKRLIASLFNVKAWVDFERIRSGKRYIVDQFHTYFVPHEARQIESFESAQIRLKLSDNELYARQKGLLRLSLMMVIAAAGVFVYALYNLFYGYFLAVLISVVVMFIALALAFRYHFWYFQIKNKQLGCSLHEWFKQVILGVKE